MVFLRVQPQDKFNSLKVYNFRFECLWNIDENIEKSSLENTLLKRTLNLAMLSGDMGPPNQMMGQLMHPGNSMVGGSPSQGPSFMQQYPPQQQFNPSLAMIPTNQVRSKLAKGCFINNKYFLFVCRI